MAEGEDDRRHTANLEGVLRFCVENTKTEDAPEELRQAMDDSRKQWLEEVLSEFKGADPVKHMVTNINVVVECSTSREDKEEAFESLLMYVEDLDLANAFHKVGGYALLDTFLHHEYASLRAYTAQLIALLAQNNPYSQTELFKAGYMSPLMDMVRSTGEEDVVRVKAIHAVSCIVRNNEVGLESFLARDGFSLLLAAMRSSVEKLQIKAAFLLRALCEKDEVTGDDQPQVVDVSDHVVNMGMVEQLVSMLNDEHAAFHEFILNTLVLLAQQRDQARHECQRPELQLSQLLSARINTLGQREEHQEALGFCKQLQQLCFGAGSGDSTVDR